MGDQEKFITPCNDCARQGCLQVQSAARGQAPTLGLIPTGNRQRFHRRGRAAHGAAVLPAGECHLAAGGEAGPANAGALRVGRQGLQRYHYLRRAPRRTAALPRGHGEPDHQVRPDLRQGHCTRWVTVQVRRVPWTHSRSLSPASLPQMSSAQFSPAQPSPVAAQLRPRSAKPRPDQPSWSPAQPRPTPPCPKPA